MQDTFFISMNPDILLRTHTSSVQVRVMEKQQPPIRTISPGRVFRNEAISARAHCIFHQVEGLYIDENVSFADLRQVLFYFAREMFGKENRYPAYGLPFSLLPNHLLKWIFPAVFAGEKVVMFVSIPAGLKSWAVVWLIRMFLKIATLIPQNIPVMHLVWG